MRIVRRQNDARRFTYCDVIFLTMRVTDWLQVSSMKTAKKRNRVMEKELDRERETERDRERERDREGEKKERGERGKEK